MRRRSSRIHLPATASRCASTLRDRHPHARRRARVDLVSDDNHSTSRDAILNGGPVTKRRGPRSAKRRTRPRRALTVDDFLRTSNRRIYAAGDVASPTSTPTWPTRRRALWYAMHCSPCAKLQRADDSMVHLHRSRDRPCRAIPARCQGATSREQFTVMLHEVDRAIVDGEHRIREDHVRKAPTESSVRPSWPVMRVK